MAINIKLDGNDIHGNAKVLGNLHINGKSNANIGVSNSSIGGSSQVLNDMDIPKGSSVNIQIDDSKIGGNSIVFNSVNETEGNVDINDLNESINTSNLKTSPVKTSHKKDSIIKRFLNFILKMSAPRENDDESLQVTHSKTRHQIFESEISRGGSLKNIDISEVLNSMARDNKESERDQDSSKEVR